MKNEDWFSRYQFCAPLGQCGTSTFFLAKDLTKQTHVVVKQYVNNTQKEGAARQMEAFQDEAHLFSVLQEKGVMRFFDQQIIDGKFFLVTDVPSACELMCTHIKPEAIERAINQNGF